MFTITEQAKQYIHAHGGHVIIYNGPLVKTTF